MLGKSMLAAGLAAFALTCAAHAETGVSDDAIKIGVHTALTGVASFVGQGGKVGIEAAVAEINAHGGINGRRIDLSIIDDKGSPDGGVAAVRRLVDDQEVFAVFGAGPSGSTVAVVPFFAQSDVPYFVSFASDPRVLENFAPNIYSGATVPQQDAVAYYARFLAGNLKAKKVAMMVCDQGHCTSAGPKVEALLQDAGVTVSKSSYNSGDTDFTGQIEQIKAAQPDAVFLLGLATDEGRIIPQIRRAGLDLPLVTDVSGADLTVLRLAGDAAEGYYTFWIGGSQFYDDNTGEMAKFLKSLDEHKIERPANTPNLYTLMGYADVYVLAEAIRAAGKDLTRDGLLKSLDNIRDFVGGTTPEWSYAAALGYPRSFTPDDHKGTKGIQPVVVKGGTFKAVTD